MGLPILVGKFPNKKGPLNCHGPFLKKITGSQYGTLLSNPSVDDCQKSEPARIFTPAANPELPHPLFQAVFRRLTDEMLITRIGLLERQLPTLVKWYWIGQSRCVAA